MLNFTVLIRPTAGNGIINNKILEALPDSSADLKAEPFLLP